MIYVYYQHICALGNQSIKKDVGLCIECKKLDGGQSNPTFILQLPSTKLVLRKKPALVKVASAHAVEREYRVLKALQGNSRSNHQRWMNA